MCTVRRAFFAGWTDLSEGEGGALPNPMWRCFWENSRPQQVDERGWERAREQECRCEARKASGTGHVSLGAGSLLWQQGAFAGWARAAPWLRSGRVTLTRTPVCQSGPRKWASRCHGKEGAHQGRRAGQPLRVLLASARMCWKALSGQGRPPHTGQQGQAPIRSVYSKAGAGGPDQALHPRAWAQQPSAGEPWASSHLSHLATAEVAGLGG